MMRSIVLKDPPILTFVGVGWYNVLYRSLCGVAAFGDALYDNTIKARNGA
jgi:hypothetical protein